MRANVGIGFARGGLHDRPVRDRHLDIPEQRSPAFQSHRQHVHVAEEVHHEGIRGVLENLRGRPRLFDAAFVHNHDAVRDFKRLGLIVRDEDTRHVKFVVKLPQPRPQFLAHFGIECAERLVE